MIIDFIFAKIKAVVLQNIKLCKQNTSPIQNSQQFYIVPFHKILVFSFKKQKGHNKSNNLLIRGPILSRTECSFAKYQTLPSVKKTTVKMKLTQASHFFSNQ